MTRKIPRRIGGFAELEPAAEGGMSVIYRAVKVGDRSGARWALKFPPSDVGIAPDMSARLRREAEMVRLMPAHRGIVPVESIGTFGDEPFLVMPWVEGVSLRHVIQAVERGDLAIVPERVDAAVQLAIDTLEAIAFAHGHNVVHRDVSPENILVGLDGTVHLTDFGIAGVFRGEGMKTRLGKWPYMAPEHRAGSAEPRSDLYALGVTLCELLGAPIDGETITPPPTGNAAFDELLRTVLAPVADRPNAEAALTAARGARAVGSGQDGRQQLRDIVSRLTPRGTDLRQRVAAASRQTAIASMVLAAALAVLTLVAVIFDTTAGAVTIDAGLDRRPTDGGIDGGDCTELLACVGPCVAGTGNAAACLDCADHLRRGTTECALPDPAKAAALEAAQCDEARTPAACARLALRTGLLVDRDRAPRWRNEIAGQWPTSGQGPLSMLAISCDAGGKDDRRAALACAALELLGAPASPNDKARQALCTHATGDDPKACAKNVAATACENDQIAEACALVQYRDRLDDMCKAGDRAACVYRWLDHTSQEPVPRNICTGDRGTALGCRLVAADAKKPSLAIWQRGCELGDCEPLPGLKPAQMLPTLQDQCSKGRVSACANLVFQLRAAHDKWEEAWNQAQGQFGSTIGALPAVPAAARGYLEACYLGSIRACARIANTKLDTDLVVGVRQYLERLENPLQAAPR